jgi:hypothetical protein
VVVHFLVLARLFTERINDINTMKTHGDKSNGETQTRRSLLW